MKNVVSCGYCACNYDFPLCNHTKCVSEENLGYMRGVTFDGIPFEAEIFESGDILGLSVIMPQIYERTYKSNMTLKSDDSNVVQLGQNVESYDWSVLPIGMVDEGVEEDLSVTLSYVDFLVEHEIVEFTGDMWNGAVMYVEDRACNMFARVIITLKEGNEFFGETDLELKEFPKVKDKKKKTEFKVIKGRDIEFYKHMVE